MVTRVVSKGPGLGALLRLRPSRDDPFASGVSCGFHRCALRSRALGERLDYSTQPLIWAAITAAAMKRYLAHMTQRLTGVRTSTHKLAKGAKMEVLESQFGDSKYRPAPLLRKMVDAGYLGRKRGRGSFECGQWWVISVWLG